LGSSSSNEAHSILLITTTDGFSDNMRKVLREYVSRIHGSIKLCLKVDPDSLKK